MVTMPVVPMAPAMETVASVTAMTSSTACFNNRHRENPQHRRRQGQNPKKCFCHK